MISNRASFAIQRSTLSRTRTARCIRAGLILASVCLVSRGAAHAADAALQYNRDVRPILAANCFACHGPDSASRKADLRLDRREAAVEMGAIAPGKPDESELVRRILSADEDEMMPPPASHKKLTDAQREVLRRWVAEGAAYQPHWSFIAPQRPAPPAVKNEAWIRNPIDRFVLSQLEAAKLEPAPEADRRTLARRASLDITGLPPAPEVIEAFVADTSADAYEKLLDKLLASQAWGEHRGRYWLDYARYADTHGAHFDNYREMWSYRDWVIRAFNRNLPYDQFTIESLAGDLLPNRTLDQQIGSGFNRCQLTTNEGGIIDEEYLVLYTRDRVEATSLVWMGLTAGCAVCHDHKFDPLSQREFYELAAFFNNTTQGARDGNIKDSPPIVAVPPAEDRERSQAIEAELAATKGKQTERMALARPEFDAWLAAAKPEEFSKQLPADGLHLHAPLDEGSGETIHVKLNDAVRELPLPKTATWQPGRASSQALNVSQGQVAAIAEAGDFDRTQAFSCSAWVKLPANDSNGAIAARMDNKNSYRGWDFWIEGRRIGTHIVHRWQDDALKVVSNAQIPANQWTHVVVSYDGSSKAAGVKIYIDGQPQPVGIQADSLKSTIKTQVPFKIGQRDASEPISGVSLQDLRIYSRALAPAEAAALGSAARFAALLSKPAAERTPAEHDEIYAWWLSARDEPSQTLAARVAQLEREQADLKARSTIGYVMQEKSEPAMAFVLFRGEYDKRRDQVSPEVPDILPPFPANAPRNRLGFAQWLLLPEHPLTARVTVNRYWQEVFGTGIVRTAGDFGVSGELPSHPELLDWLAVEFRESGWDVKKLFKLVLTSAAYRQAALATPAKLELDPQNRLLSRGPRFRMDAEMVRDYALASSGLLTPAIGGPSVKPYQPEGVWEAIAMNVSNTRSYQRDTGANLYRRSLYTFWKRMAPPASMDIFNAPNREYCVVRRERTNTPLQALVTLNDEQFIEAARALAGRAMLAWPSTDERLYFVGNRILGRHFQPEELQIIRTSLEGLAAHYQAHPEDAAKLIAVGETKSDPKLDAKELAAWTMLVNELMNLDEVLCK